VPEFDVDQLAATVATEARKVLQEAEARAREIVGAAERDAGELRARAEAEARDKVEGARRALEELTSRFGSGTAAPPASVPEPPAPSPPPAGPPPAPEVPEPAPAPEPATQAPPARDDTQAARLVAMKMALDGASREEIDAELGRSYSLADRAALVDEVLAKAGK